ncbi:MAG: hypothetical protein REJ50_18170 [Bordetella sp.]|nr:hypothetical protein [Bordetella sp.]
MSEVRPLPASRWAVSCCITALLAVCAAALGERAQMWSLDHSAGPLAVRPSLAGTVSFTLASACLAVLVCACTLLRAQQSRPGRVPVAPRAWSLVYGVTLALLYGAWLQGMNHLSLHGFYAATDAWLQAHGVAQPLTRLALFMNLRSLINLLVLMLATWLLLRAVMGVARWRHDPRPARPRLRRTWIVWLAAGATYAWQTAMLRLAAGWLAALQARTEGLVPWLTWLALPLAAGLVVALAVRHTLPATPRSTGVSRAVGVGTTAFWVAQGAMAALAAPLAAALSSAAWQRLLGMPVFGLAALAAYLVLLAVLASSLARSAFRTYEGPLSETSQA